ncbi:MAG TPA: DUF899 family protein [Candidatus Dormibacteraeota bacterium]|nr:DUF899 family protein [Candidatus Dormibacteraeota bacterium]
MTRRREARRVLPWELVEKEYRFEGPAGRITLSDLFDGRSQLVVYHAMFNPDMATPETTWTTDAACKICSWWIDNFDGIAVHLNHRDVTILAASRAPYSKIAAYKQRMGWMIPWVSAESDFNFDYGVSFTPEDLESGEATYNYGSANYAFCHRVRGDQRLSKGRPGQDLPHVLDLRPRSGHAQRRIPLPRPRSEGSSRGNNARHPVVAPTRRVRRQAARDCVIHTVPSRAFTLMLRELPAFTNPDALCETLGFCSSAASISTHSRSAMRTCRRPHLWRDTQDHWPSVVG